MMAEQYSSVIPTMLAFGDALEAATWPGDTPVVAVAGTRDAGRELVLIGSGVPDIEQSFAGMRASPHARHEDYTLAVYVETTAPGQTTGDALARLQELVTVVEHVARNRPQGWGHGVHTFELGAPVLNNAVATPEGFTASAVLAVRVHARLQGG